MKGLYKTAAVILAGCLFTGCSGGNKLEAKANQNAITIATNSESGSLDPSGVIALTYLAYSVTALDELLTFDEEGNIIYRGAESYDASADMTEFTFHLRKDAKWSDGSPVTAKDYINTIVRALDPASGSGYANYLFPIVGAEEFYKGTGNIEALGVTADEDYTLTFRLKEPCVYFLDLLRLPVYTPSCAEYAVETGSGWDKTPGESLSNGPFYLTEYVPEEYFVLEKNPYYWDKDQISLDKITYRFMDNQQSMANAYKTGEVDVAPGVPDYIMEQYANRSDLVVAPLIATRYFYPNLRVKPLDDVRVRKALALAINRKELCAMVGNDTEPTTSFVAKYMIDKTTGRRFIEESDPPFTENIEEAQKLLAEAGYPNGDGFPVLTYSYPSLEMDSDTAQALQSQLKEHLNVDIMLQPQELQVHYAERRAENFELCRMNWTADFSDPVTYLSMLESDNAYNCSGVADPEYDGILAKADQETDPNKRMELLHKAEAMVVGEKFYIIPLFAMTSCNLVNPSIKNIGRIAASGAMEYRYAYLQAEE